MDGPATLIGRESERATLRSPWSRPFSGEPGLVLVHGEAGIGKTSLVREACPGRAGTAATMCCLVSAFGSERT